MIEVKNLTKEFKKQKRKPGVKGMFTSLFSKEYEVKKAVDDVSFTINRGEIVGYIGANGAGKSTTIKMMTGILNPTSGTVLVNGIFPYEKRIENGKNIGVVFGQRTQLWWDLPLIETFSILKEIYNVPENEYKERFKFLSEVLGLDDFINSPVRTLSLGQRMRADLAAAFMHNPKVIYLDEPTIGLDVLVKEKIREAIKYINKTYQTTIILTTHDMSDIEDLCHRLIIIDEGKILYDGDVENIKERFGNKRKIVVEISDLNQVNEFNINQYLPDVCQQKLDDSHLCFQFEAHKTSFEQISTIIFKHLTILDMKITETSIEDIVKDIYQKGNL